MLVSDSIPPPLPGAPMPVRPPELDYQGRVMVDRDIEHLRILVVCWYVMSGLTALFGCFPIIHLTVGLAMIFLPGVFKPDPPPPFIGWFFVIFASVFILGFWICAVLGFLAGRSLQKRRWLGFCYVAAGIACVQFPFGTAVGVFTFVVLSRPSVKAVFASAAGR